MDRLLLITACILASCMPITREHHNSDIAVWTSARWACQQKIEKKKMVFCRVEEHWFGLSSGYDCLAKIPGGDCEVVSECHRDDHNNYQC